MDFAYRPKSEEWEGTITLSMPNFDDRMSMLEDMNVEFTSGGVEVGQEMSKIGMLRKLVKASKRHYKEVSLVRKVDNKAFRSFDELSEDPRASAILIEVASEVFTSGLQLGNG